MIGMDMMLGSPVISTSFVYNEEQAEQLPRCHVRARSVAQQGYFPLRRVFVQFQEGQCWVHVRRRISRLSIFCAALIA